MSALGALGSVLPRRNHSYPGTAPWPDLQILQPKFNFQLLLALERERSKFETVRSTCVCRSQPRHLGCCGPSGEESHWPPSLDCSKKAALGLGDKTEGRGQDCSLVDRSSSLTEASGMPGKPGPLTGEESHVPGYPPKHPLPRAEALRCLHTALPEGSARSSHAGTPQPAKSPRQTALTTEGHPWSEGPGQRL